MKKTKQNTETVPVTEPIHRLRLPPLASGATFTKVALLQHPHFSRDQVSLPPHVGQLQSPSSSVGTQLSMPGGDPGDQELQTPQYPVTAPRLVHQALFLLLTMAVPFFVF